MTRATGLSGKEKRKGRIANTHLVTGRMAEPLSVLFESTVSCSFLFLSDLLLYQTTKPYFYSGELKPEHECQRTNLVYTEHDGIQVRDLRGFQHKLDLGFHGFCFLSCQSKVDLSIPNETTTLAYLRETCATIKDLLEAEKVVCYDYKVCIHGLPF